MLIVIRPFLPWAAANLAGLVTEDVIGDVFAEQKHHINSPTASGRIACAVYHAVTSAGFPAPVAAYLAAWSATDGGDLLPVPDGTCPNWVPDPDLDGIPMEAEPAEPLLKLLPGWDITWP